MVERLEQVLRGGIPGICTLDCGTMNLPEDRSADNTGTGAMGGDDETGRQARSK
jgi:hypothetical protein